jgi:hypothetical protein
VCNIEGVCSDLNDCCMAMTKLRFSDAGAAITDPELDDCRAAAATGKDVTQASCAAYFSTLADKFGDAGRVALDADAATTTRLACPFTGR